MGPDEFHEKYPGANKGGMKNNAYTNVMAVWVIEKALHILDDMIAEEEKMALLLKTEISEEEIVRWRDIIQKMAVIMDKNGIIHQFEGYMDLEELDVWSFGPVGITRKLSLLRSMISLWGQRPWRSC